MDFRAGYEEKSGSKARNEIGARFVRTRGKMFGRVSVRSRWIINERGPRGIGRERERGWERRKSKDRKEEEPECIARRLVLIVIPGERVAPQRRTRPMNISCWTFYIYIYIHREFYLDKCQACKLSEVGSALDAVPTNNLGINCSDAGATFEWPRNAILHANGRAGLCEIKPSFEPRDLDALLVPTTLAFFHPNYFIPFNFISNGRLFFLFNVIALPHGFRALSSHESHEHQFPAKRPFLPENLRAKIR